MVCEPGAPLPPPPTGSQASRKKITAAPAGVRRLCAQRRPRRAHGQAGRTTWPLDQGGRGDPRLLSPPEPTGLSQRPQRSQDDEGPVPEVAAGSEPGGGAGAGAGLGTWGPGDLGTCGALTLLGLLLPRQRAAQLAQERFVLLHPGGARGGRARRRGGHGPSASRQVAARSPGGAGRARPPPSPPALSPAGVPAPRRTGSPSPADKSHSWRGGVEGGPGPSARARHSRPFVLPLCAAGLLEAAGKPRRSTRLHTRVISAKEPPETGRVAGDLCGQELGGPGLPGTHCDLLVNLCCWDRCGGGTGVVGARGAPPG